MVAILFRAFSTVVTVVIAVIVSATLGDSSSGRVWAAVLIATVIAVVEWLLYWTPAHFAAARRLLDPRANMVGIWLQNVRRVLHQVAAGEGEERNRFAIFWVDYQDSGDYCVTGFAYDPAGVEHSRWESIGSPEFAKDGLSMTYRWTGTIMGTDVGDNDPDRNGIASVDLRKGTGRVEHVGMNLSVLFDVEQVTRERLGDIGLGQLKPVDLKAGRIRDRVALAIARSLRSD